MQGRLRPVTETRLQSGCVEAPGDKLLDGDDVTLHDVTAHAHRHRVAVAEPALEMLRTAETAQPTIDHYSQPCTQHLALLHTTHSTRHMSYTC